MMKQRSFLDAVSTKEPAARRGCDRALATGLAPFEAQAAGGLVALVHTQAAGDNGPVDPMIAKLQQLSKEKGFAARVVYASDPATYETIFRTLGDAGATVIVSTFNEVAEPIKALAPSYPKTKWIQLFGDPLKPSLPNVTTVSYDYYLGCYLSGMFGALISKGGKLGYIGGISLPPLNADVNAIKAGATSVNATATLNAAFAGSFQDPAKGHGDPRTQMYQVGRRLHPDRFGRDRHRHHRRGQRRRGPVGQRASRPAQYKLGPKTVAA